MGVCLRLLIPSGSANNLESQNSALTGCPCKAPGGLRLMPVSEEDEEYNKENSP